MTPSRSMSPRLTGRKMILYSFLVSEDQLGDGSTENPFLVTSGTPGNKRLGELIRHLREQRNLSASDLATLANVHVSFVRGIERGAQAPSMATAKELLLHVALDGEVEWSDDLPYDVLISDDQTDGHIAFIFRAEVRGQNKRLDEAEALRRSLLVFSPQKKSEQLSHEELFRELKTWRRALILASAPFGNLEEDRPRGSNESCGNDAALGRIVRQLANADKATLMEIESLLVRNKPLTHNVEANEQTR